MNNLKDTTIEQLIKLHNLSKKNHIVKINEEGKLENAPKDNSFNLIEDLILENNDISR